MISLKSNIEVLVVVVDNNLASGVNFWMYTIVKTTDNMDCTSHDRFTVKLHAVVPMSAANNKP